MRKYFKHEPIEFEELVTESVGGMRHYKTPTGELYPSVTTVLSSLNKDAIAEWRQKVGEEAANKISTQASRRGTSVHKLAEDYLNNKDDYKKGHMPFNIHSFEQIRPYLDQHVDLVYANEIPLYSHQLKTAGRCDAIVRMHGTRTIVDFKTAKKKKNEQWITNYFYQCTAYALMLHEMTGLYCHYICLLISTDEDGLQVILKSSNAYKQETINFFTQYHANKKIMLTEFD